jgi:hypothetical protein
MDGWTGVQRFADRYHSVFVRASNKKDLPIVGGCLITPYIVLSIMVSRR